MSFLNPNDKIQMTNLGSLLGKLLIKKEGQALIEAIAAIGIIVAGVLGALYFLSSSIGLNRVVTAEYAGTYIAADYIESYKNCLDTEGWNHWNSCFDIAKEGIKVDDVNGNNFTLVYNGNNSNCSKDLEDSMIRVCATVSWKEKGNDFSVSLEDHFYNWRNNE